MDGKIQSCLHSAKEDIKKVDFKIDIEKLKTDIKNETRKIF